MGFECLFLLFCAVTWVTSKVDVVVHEPQTQFRTIVTTKNYFKSVTNSMPPIDNKPHHLYIGRCSENDRLLHQENIVVNNDGKSQVFARVLTRIYERVNITCVKVLDQMEGGGPYPSFSSGGVGSNYVEFDVRAKYGAGFHLVLQIFGQRSTN